MPAPIELADRLTLTELVTRLTRSIDLKRFDTLAGLYGPDAVLHTPVGAIEGPEAIADFARRGHEQYEQTQHLVSGTTVDADDEEAAVVADVVAVFVPLASDPGTNIQLGSRYELALTRSGNGWSIARHTITPVWQRTPGN